MNTQIKILLLILITLLQTGCYSYKVFNESPSQITVGERYHLDLKDKKELSIWVDSISETSLYFTRRKKQREVPFENIRRIEEGKFSTGKTIGFSALINLSALALTGIIALLVAFG